MSTHTTLMTCRLPDRDGYFDVTLLDGHIGAIDPSGTHAPHSGSHSMNGRLLLPAFADGHIHLDKSFIGLPWRPHVVGPTIAARIAAERSERACIAMPLAERAHRLIDRVIGFGTLALRSHIDVDEDLGLGHVETLLEVRAAVADRIDIQFVAFPQSGITPRVADLLDQALGMGIEVIGGLDPAGIDGNIEGHLGTVFGLAERHGCRIDIHLHDPGTLGTFELRQIAARTKALGLHGRVAVSHAFALGMVDEPELQRTAAVLAEAGVAIMTHGPGGAAIPPITRLLAAGVTVFGGSDNIRDAWSPFGNGDLLQRAATIGYRSNFRSDVDLELAFNLVTRASRKVMGLPSVTLDVGSPADLVALHAEGIPEAVATVPADRIVMRAGKVVKSGTDAGTGD